MLLSVSVCTPSGLCGLANLRVDTVYVVQEYGDYAYSDDAQYDYGYDTFNNEDDAYYRGYDRRRLLSDDLKLDFNDDDQWDEIVHSYSFGGADNDNFGRYGEQRSDTDNTPSSAVSEMMDTMKSESFRPKFMYRSAPHLYPTIKKCVHSRILRICIKLDVHHKNAKMGMWYTVISV